MKFCVSFLLLLLFDTLQGSTLSHVRKVRSLNTTLQTNFNGTYERRNPCTNAEIERSSYIASHEFHHHTNEDNWSDYTHKCSAIISSFLQAIGNLVRFNNKQNGLFNFHINTSISQKQIGDRKSGKCCETMPTILIEATDCQVTPRKNKETEGKFDGPVCLPNRRNKTGPRTISQISFEQNADEVNPAIINSNQKVLQNERQDIEKDIKQAWNPIRNSLGDTGEPLKVEDTQTLSNGIVQTSVEFVTPTTPLPQSEPQVIPVTTSYEPSQSNFGLGNSPGFQATPFENANEQRNFNTPAATPNMPFAPQPSFSGIPPQSTVSISNEEIISPNQLPPALPNQQGLPLTTTQNDNLEVQVSSSLMREPDSYPNQMPEIVPTPQIQDIAQGGPQGGPGYPQNPPAFMPTDNGQNPNLQISGNYPPPPQQAPPMKNSFELPPTDYNNNPSQVGLTETQASGQISDMTQNVDSNFTPDQQQPVTTEQTEIVYYNDEPTNYNQAPTVPSPEIQPEFLPTRPLFLAPESQQTLPEYSSEIATNEQPPMKPMEVLPSDSVAPKDAIFSDSLVVSNEGVGTAYNLPVGSSFEPTDSQLPISPSVTAPQQQYTTPPSLESTFQDQRVGTPEFQVPPNQMPGPSEISDGLSTNSFSNQPPSNTFIQPVPVGNISPSNDYYTEQPRDEFDGPQQPDSPDLVPTESPPSQIIPTLGPQPSPDFTEQVTKNEMFEAVPQNFQNTDPVDDVPVQSSSIVPPTSEITTQTAMEDSQFDYPTSTERPEPAVSGLVPNNIGNQLSELTANNKPVLNSNDFQPETQSYFTETSDRNLDYTTQTPFYDSIPADYKSKPESQPGLIPSVQSISERPTTPAPEQAFPPTGLESFPTAPELPTSTPDVTNTEQYSEQTTQEFGSSPTNPEFVNPPGNGFQMFGRRPNPRFIPREQIFGDDTQTIAMQQPNPTPEISNPLDTNQPLLENNPTLPQQPQPQFYPNQNGDIQQTFPETTVTSQPSAQMATQQEAETVTETSEFPSAVPLQDQPITAVYPQPPVQSDVPNYDFQPDNQAQIQSEVSNYDVQPVQPLVQSDVSNYDFQSSNQSSLQSEVPNFDVQTITQPPLPSDVPSYDVQPIQTPVQSEIPNYAVQPVQPLVQSNVSNYDFQSANQSSLQSDIPNYDFRPVTQPPMQSDFPNYDVQPGNQPPVQSDLQNYDLQLGNQTPIQSEIPNNDFQPTTQLPVQSEIPNYDDQPAQPPIQSEIPNYDFQPDNQTPIQSDVPNYDFQSGNQTAIQSEVSNYDVQPPNQPPIESGVPNSDFQTVTQPPLQSDIPNYDVQPVEALVPSDVSNYDVQPVQPPVQSDLQNYDLQSGNQSPIQSEIPNYDFQPVTQPPLQSDVPSYEAQSVQPPVQTDVPNYDFQPENQTKVQSYVTNYDVQPSNQPPVHSDISNYDFQPVTQPPVESKIPSYDVQPEQALVQPEVSNYDVQPVQPPVQPDIPNYDVQSSNQLPVQTGVPNYDFQSVTQPLVQSDVPNYEVQPGNQTPVQSGIPNYDFQPVTQSAVQSGVPNRDLQPVTQPPEQSGVQNYDFQPVSQPPIQSDVPNYNVQPVNQPPNASAYYTESQEQIVNTETASAESTPSKDLESNIPPSGPGASESFPNRYPPIEQQSAGFDESQMPQQNYPNAGFPSRQALPVFLQPEPQMPGNDQFPPQTDSNLQPVTFPPQTGPMNSQNGVNRDELQAFVPSASSPQTGVTPFPLSRLQTVPENSQVNNFTVGTETSAASEVLPRGTDTLTLNPDQPSGIGQPQSQDLSTQDQFAPAVPPQFTTESSGEVTTDYPDQYQPRPSEDNFGGVPGVQTANQMLTTIDEYQNPAPTTQEPLSYTQERLNDVVRTTPPPFQADQFLTSTQSQSEYVQSNAAMYSPNLAPRPQPQPSFDNLTEFPGDITAGSTTQTPLPSEIKPETFGSQPPRQTALTETNIPDTDNTKTLDTLPNSGTSDYLGPQIYPNFDVPAPAVNYPTQDRRSFPPTADSSARDMTYQTANPAFTPSLTVPTFGINPIQTVFNSNSSYFSTAVTPGEGSETQPFRQASALIASPQPQPTTVKYNEQIIIPQYQTPPAPNPQPQATLKYADQHSGDNAEEGLLDSVAWTFPGRQGATGIAPSPRYQTTPLRSRFPPSNAEFSTENKGRPFLPGQKQQVPVTPSFEQQQNYSNGNTTTKIVQEAITADFPVELESPSFAEDQLALADKLLNRGAPVQKSDQRPQIQLTSTNTTVETESFVTPPRPFQYPMEIRTQPQMQSSPLTRFEEIESDSPASRPGPFQQKVQLQTYLQSFPSTNNRLLTTDALVSPSTTFQPKIEDRHQINLERLDSTNITAVVTEPPVFTPFPPPLLQPQTQLQPLSSTMSRQILNNSLVRPPTTFSPQIEAQNQSQHEGFYSTNITEDIAVNPSILQLPQQQRIDVQPQTELHPFSATISREILTDSLARPLTTFQPQTEGQVQPQVEEFDSTNITEVMTEPSITTPPSFEQQIHIQPQIEPQPYSSTISRETLTDSLVTPPPSFEPRAVDQPQPQLQSFSSTNVREMTTDSAVIQPLPAPQQINVQTQLQPSSLTISREIVSDSLVTPSPPFQPQIQYEPQPQAEQFDSTNIREDVSVNPATPSLPLQQEIGTQPQPQLQTFTSTITKQDVTIPRVSSTPPNHSQIAVRPQIQFQSFPSTNFRVVTTNSAVPPPPFEQPTGVQPQPKLEGFDSTNITEDVAVNPMTTPFPFQQPQPFSSTISREIVTDSLMSQPPPLQPQIESQDQPQVEQFDSANISENIAMPSATPLQPFSSTISREVVTDSLVTPQPPLEAPTEVQSQRQLQPYPSTNIKEVIATTSTIPTSPFPQQVITQPQTEVQYPTTIMREDVTLTPTPSVQQQTDVQLQPELQSFSSTNVREITADSPVIQSLPVPQQINAQTQLQPSSITLSREIVNDSLATPPPPFQPQFEYQPQPQVKQFDSTNIREDVGVNPATLQLPQQQQIDFQPQTEPYPLSSTISRGIISDSLVSQPTPLQPQIEDQPQPQVEQFDSTNIRKDVGVNPATLQLPQQQQIDFQPQTELQPFSSTVSREDVTDSLLIQLPPFQPHTDLQPQPGIQFFLPTNRTEIITDSSATPSVPGPQQIHVQTQPQSSSVTLSREIVTDSLVTPPPPLQPQPQLQSFPSTNMKEIAAIPPVTPSTQFPQKNVVQPETESQYRTRILTEVITDSLVTPPSQSSQVEVFTQPRPLSANTREVIPYSPIIPSQPFQQQTDAQPQSQPQPFSSTISREIVTDSLVTPIPPLQPQIEDQPQPQVKQFDSTNVREDVAVNPVTTPLPFLQKTNVQPKTELQPSSVTLSREIVTHSLVTPPPPLQLQIEDQSQPQLQSFPLGNMKEETATSSVTPPTQFPQPETEDQYRRKIMTEVITDSLVTPPSQASQQVEVFTQPRPLSTNTREIVTESPITPPQSFIQQTEFQPQMEPQSFPSTTSREIISDSLVTPPPPVEPQNMNLTQHILKRLDSTYITEVVTEPSVMTPPPFEQQIHVQPQTEPQPFSSKVSRDMVTDSLVTPPPSFEPRAVDQPQPQLQSFSSTNVREMTTDSAVIQPLPAPQQINVQTQLQPSSLTITREIVSDSLVTPSPPFQPQIEYEPQPQAEQFDSTNIREDVSVNPATPSLPLQQEIESQPQPQLQSFSSTNVREMTPDSPVIQPLPAPQQINVQTQLQPSSLTITREIVSDSLVTPSPPFQPQIQYQPQPQAEQFDSTNIREDVAVNPATPSLPLQQEIESQPQPQLQTFTSTNVREMTPDSPVIQPLPAPQQINVQTQLQPSSLTISREIVTDSLVTPSPPFQPQIQDDSRPLPEQFYTTKIREYENSTPESSQIPIQPQIVVQPKLQFQTLPSTNIRAITTDSLLTPSIFQPKNPITVQPKLQGFDSTNITEVVTVAPLMTPPSLELRSDAQSQTELQPFSSTISRDTLTESSVSPPPPFQPQTEGQAQPRVEEFDSTDIRKDINFSPDTQTSLFQQQMNVQPQSRLQPFPSTNMREIIPEPAVSLLRPLQPQIVVLPQLQFQSFPSTNFRVVTTNSPVLPPPFEQKTGVQPQPKLEGFNSTNMREDRTVPPDTQTSPFQQQTNVQPQPRLQSFPSAVLKKDITIPPISFILPIQQPFVVRPQLPFQSFPSTNIRPVTTNSPVLPPPFQQPTGVQPQPKLEGFDSTNIREDVAVISVTPPPPLQNETDAQPQTQLQPYSSTISREIMTDSLLTPPPPFQPQIVVRPQLQFQSFPSTNIRVVTTNSSVPPPPFEQKTGVQPQSKLEGSDSTNVREVVTEASVITPPPFEQQTDALPQTELRPFSSSISEELVNDSLVTPIPPFQPQILVLPQQQFQIISSANTREDIAGSPVTVSPLSEQQTNDFRQTQLQPFSSTTSKETVTDSLMNQPSPFEPQNDVQAKSQLLPPSPNVTDSPVQQRLESQPQPGLQSFSSRRDIMTGPFINPPPSFPRVEMRPQPELIAFPSAVPIISYVYPPTLVQQDVETQRQLDLRNFPSRNTTETFSDSPIGISAPFQGARKRVQNQTHAFPAGIREVPSDSLANPAAKLEKHVAQEFQTQRTRYTTTNTKEVITESFLPTADSVYAESGKDGQLKAVEIRSDPEGNHGKKTIEVVEEIITDFPPVSEFASLEDEFALAEKLLNNSAVAKTTSYVTVSPLEENNEKVVTTAVVEEPRDYTSISRKSENSVPLSKSAAVNKDTEYSQSVPANKPMAASSLGGFPDFRTSDRQVFYTSSTSPDYQDDHEEASQWDPILQTLQTHLSFPLHEPPPLPTSTPGPWRASPLPLLDALFPASPIKARRRYSWPNLENVKNYGNAGQTMKTEPQFDPPVPVSKPTGPSNGPDPLKELILKNHEMVLNNSSPDEMAPGSRGEN